MTPTEGRSDQVLVHFYRAVVTHADAWRQRMDATTNWAAATTAAMISVSFSGDAPHFVLLLTLGFDTMFLLMESRRYQVYDLWRRRVHWLNRYYVTPALSPALAPPPEVTQGALDELAADLGRTIPHICLRDAIGYRVQRNYGYLFAVGLLGWILKLGVDPVQAETVGELARRARVGPFPGEAVFLAVALVMGTIAFVAILAPTERMIGWTEAPSRWKRWQDRRRGPKREPLEGGEIPPAPMDA